jgi:hypothetical protein
MVGLTFEDDLNAADADDRGHHADIERLRFKDDALLDMQLEEGADVAAFGLIEPVRIAANPPQGLAQLFATRLGQIEHPAVERAGHAAAAHA